MKYFSLSLLFIFLGLMLGCKPKSVVIVDKNEPQKRILSAADSFTLSKTACFGRCPVFECTMRGDGSASYKGTKFVSNIGSFATQVPKDSVANFISALDAMGFDTMKNEYLSAVKDLPSVLIQYKGKTVKGHLRNLPDAFKALVTRVDTVISQSKWVSTIKE